MGKKRNPKSWAGGDISSNLFNAYIVVSAIVAANEIGL